MKTEFYGKSGLFRTGAILATLLACICVLMAILFYSGLSQPKNGIPGPLAAARLLLATLPISFLAMLFWFHVLARRRPLVRICQEGLELNVVGRGSLDDVPGIPISIKLAWLILSLQGFRKQLAWVPWEAYQRTIVARMPLAKTLTIYGTVAFPTFRGEEIKASVTDHISFRGSELRDPLDNIANAIESTFHDPPTWSALPSLHDA